MAKNDESFAEFETKVGDNFGEDYGSGDLTYGVWKKTSDEVTEGKKIGEGVIEDVDEAMDPVSFNNV